MVYWFNVYVYRWCHYIRQFKKMKGDIKHEISSNFAMKLFALKCQDGDVSVDKDAFYKTYQLPQSLSSIAVDDIISIEVPFQKRLVKLLLEITSIHSHENVPKDDEKSMTMLIDYLDPCVSRVRKVVNKRYESFREKKEMIERAIIRSGNEYEKDSEKQSKYSLFNKEYKLFDQYPELKTDCELSEKDEEILEKLAETVDKSINDMFEDRIRLVEKRVEKNRPIVFV